MSERSSVVEQMMSKTLHECQHRRWPAILPMVDNKSSVMLHSTVHTHFRKRRETPMINKSIGAATPSRFVENHQCPRPLSGVSKWPSCLREFFELQFDGNRKPQALSFTNVYLKRKVTK